MQTLKRNPGWLPSLLLSLMFFLPGACHAQEPALSAPDNPTLAYADDLETYKKMSVEELMDQEVTSVAKQPETYGQAPAAIQVVSGEQIRRAGASSFPEALRLADNLDVAQVSSATWAISARGFNASVGNKLLVLIDGRSVYSPLFSGVIWNMQDYLMEDIDRIEVISGPGGTLWGANAVNGVINISSKSAKDTQGLYVEAGGGSWLQDFAGVRYGGVLATNVFFRVYGKYFDRGSEVFADGTGAHDSWNRGQGGFRIDAEPSGQNQFTVQGDAYTGKTDVVPGGEGSPQAQGNAFGGNLLARWTHTFADDADFTLQTYYDRTHLNAPFQSAALFGPVIPAGPLIDDLDTFDIDFQNRFPLGTRNRIVWGLGYRLTHDHVQAAPLVAFLPDILNQNLFSGFVQDEIRLRENLFLTLGTKVEHNDYTGFEAEPSGRLQWNVTDKQMFWGAISRAVRTPSRYDRDLFEPSPAYGSFLGAPGSAFRSETVVAYELGYRAQFAQKISGSLSVFYNNYDNLRSLNLTGGGLPLVFQNDLEGDTWGFESSADYQVLDWWRVHGGYDFLRESIRVTPGGTDLDNALNETADPQHQVFLRSSMDLPWHLAWDIGLRWIDHINNNNGGAAGTVPSYFELDSRLAWQATKQFEFSITGENLLHSRHTESGFAGPAQEQIQRSVYGKISWRF